MHEFISLIITQINNYISSTQEYWFTARINPKIIQSLIQNIYSIAFIRVNYCKMFL